MADDGRSGIERQPDRTPAASDWLSRRGGWLLVLAGVALTALAAIFATKAAVAPIFAVGGIALVVLGVLLPRVQGQFEFSATGFNLFLAELGEQTRDLDPAAKAEVLDEIVVTPSRIERAASSPEAARSVATSVAMTARQAFELEDRVARWLSDQGWTVETNVRRRHGDRWWEIDVIAERGTERLLVEVKTKLPLGAALAHTLRQLDRLRDLAQVESREEVRIALFLGERPTAVALERLLVEAHGIEFYVQAGDSFERLT